MIRLEKLKAELASVDMSDKIRMNDDYMYMGIKDHYDDPIVIAKAYGTASCFKNHPKHIYDNDVIFGSLAGYYGREKDSFNVYHGRYVASTYGNREFSTNADHFAPDYQTVLECGVGGMIERIEKSVKAHNGDEKKLNFLTAAKITMEGFSEMILGYAEAAERKAETAVGAERENFLEGAGICRRIAVNAPETFREALQLVWFVHLGFLLEGRYAMALGRLDSYLYPFYIRDTEAGLLTEDTVLELVGCTLYKITETRLFEGYDDVVNIAIGGVDKNGEDSANRLTWIIMEAVKLCRVPGPNLSARLRADSPDWFWDKCLELIGTGIGYPALMNDDVNIAALERCGYSAEDSRNYCMVGCIENFIPGKMPPWSDGRFNSPKYLELALNGGVCMQNGHKKGADTPPAEEIDTMEKFVDAFMAQLRLGAAEYVALFRCRNENLNRENMATPYMSCFCDDCIDRGLDINDGGSVYPSVHGPVCMGIGTVADSLAAIEKIVFIDHTLTLAQLRDVLRVNYEGYDDIREILLGAPKYGNNDEFVDKYARLYMDIHSDIFDKYRTWDGGRMMIAMASNTANIPAGSCIAATPDGRKNGEPLSDAASPMHGMDENGVTATLASVAKPDYTKSPCGTVLNQKFSPSAFATKEKRDKLKALFRVYFRRGGQEVQVNSVSREVLKDAIDHPENYTDLVVRVSGFSAYYVTLSDDVKKDILKRTENE